MARDLAIDLGTANTLVYMKGRGIVLNEPSVIALNRQTGEVLATGREAWQMIGRTPGYIVAVRPLRGGAITDFEITERMIRLLLQRVGVSRFTRPKVVICVPSAITEVERRAVTDAARRAGAADANLIEQPMAAAIGADLPDRRAGRQHGHRHRRRHERDGGHQPRRHRRARGGAGRIVRHRRRRSRTTCGASTASRSASARRRRSRWRSARPIRRPTRSQAEVRGRDLMTGLPKTVVLTPEEIRFAIEDVVSSIIASVIRCLAKAPPELSQDFLVRGMYLVGGGGLLRGLAERIERETKVPVRHVERAARGRGARRRSRDRALRGSQGDVHGAPAAECRLDAGRRRAVGSAPVDAGSRCRHAAERVPRAGGVPADAVLAAADEAARPSTRAATTSTAPTSAFRHARPGRVDRSRPGVRPRVGRATTSCCTTRSPTSAASSTPAGRSTPRRGSGASRSTCPTGARRCTRRRCREAAASLLPDGPRPAVVFTVRVDADGAARLDGVERAVVRSRAKLAYDDVDGRRAAAGFAELARRIVAGRGRARRAASRVPRAGARARTGPGAGRCAFEPRLASEDAERRHVAWPPTSRSPTRCWRRTPGCSG